MKKTKKNDNATVHRRKRRSNLLDDEFLVKVKDGDWSSIGLKGNFQKTGSFNWHWSYQGKLYIKPEGLWR